MKNWKIILVIFGLFAIVEASLAEDDSMVEVTAANKKKCVEYFTKNGKDYCSTKPLVPARDVDDKIVHESLQLRFDNRVWHPAWADKDTDVTTVEYVVDDESINNWHELITTQSFHDLRADVTPLQFMQRFIYFMMERGFSPVTNTISQSDNELIFEYKISEPENQQQDEIQRIFKTNKGFYIIHYVIKEPDMGAERRKKWVDLLKQAKET